MKTLPAPRLDPVVVRLDADRQCMHPGCAAPAQGHLVYLTSNTVEQREVCAAHLLALRERGPCLTFPLDACPMDRIVAEVRAEMARRQTAQPRQVFYQTIGFSNFGNVTFTTTGTAW